MRILLFSENALCFGTGTSRTISISCCCRRSLLRLLLLPYRLLLSL